MDYEEKLARLNENDFFSFFDKMHAEPRWVTSAGHKSIQILGICHRGHSHSAVFDPTTLKVTCFSQCGGGMLFHTWVKKVIDTENPQEAKDFIEQWADGEHINFDERVPIGDTDFEYKERPFERCETPPLDPIQDWEKHALLNEDFERTPFLLSHCAWHTEDKIDTDVLLLFEVALWRKENSIILPHHNADGGIVGLYQRSYRDLRRDIMKKYPEEGWNFWKQFPRAKYVPLVKEQRYLKGEEGEKTSWSFPNGKNLYGLHKTKSYIQESETAIVFEGAKSVMLAWQWGIRNTVATHTFGMGEYHVNMLLNQGAKTIILGFDKQYESMDIDTIPWRQYEHRTYEFAKRIKDHCDVYRLCDRMDGKLKYKDAPVDQGEEYFKWLLEHKEPLFIGGQDVYGAKKDEELKSDIVSGQVVAKITPEEREVLERVYEKPEFCI